jgi:hypothetical protein
MVENYYANIILIDYPPKPKISKNAIYANIPILITRHPPCIEMKLAFFLASMLFYLP